MLTYIRRAETGEVILEKDFTLRRYWPKLKELIKDYDIKYDPDNLVPVDDTLLDDSYKAGMDLLLDVGCLCLDSSRLITFEESEIKETLRNLPGKATLGEGKDEFVYEHRNVEDSSPPVIFGGPTGTPVSEKNIVKIYQSHAQEPLVNLIYMGVPPTIDGIEVKIGTPFELHAEMFNIASARTALRKVGRPGLPLYGCCFPSLHVDMASSSPEYGYKKTDLRCLWPLPQLKVDYATLIRALHFAEYGIRSNTAGIGYIGGLAGGPEGALITTIAECLAITLLFQPTSLQAIPLNSMYEPWVGESDMMALWANNVANASLAKNTKMILPYGCYTYAGPCTEMCLQEIAAEAIGATVMGAHMYAVGPNSGMIVDHTTGMEPRFRGEVALASVGMKRENANEMVKTIASKYQKIVESKNPPKGKSFEECYDAETITPSKEYQEIFNKVKKELEDLGLKFTY